MLQFQTKVVELELTRSLNLFSSWHWASNQDQCAPVICFQRVLVSVLLTFNLRYLSLKKRTVGQGFAMQNPIPIPVSAAWPPTPGLLAPTGVAPEGGIARGRCWVEAAERWFWGWIEVAAALAEKPTYLLTFLSRRHWMPILARFGRCLKYKFGTRIA